MVDDVFIGLEIPEGLDLQKMKNDISFEVYLDGVSLGTTKSTAYLLSNYLAQGKHKAGVKAVFSSITTPLTEIEFDVEEVSGVDKSEISSWSVALILQMMW